MKSSVFVNGTYAGGHIYGYTPFEVDITALVHEGEMKFLFVWTTPCSQVHDGILVQVLQEMCG